MQTATQVLVPTLEYDFFTGRRWGVAFGKNAFLSKENECVGTTALTDFRKLTENPERLEQVAHFAQSVGVKRMFLPVCSGFNALVASKGHFHRSIHSIGGTSVTALCGVCADGVFLEHQGDAGGIPSADCPTLVMGFPDGLMFMGHAGLGSVVNLNPINGKNSPRDHESVVDKVFELWKGDTSKVWAAVICGIQPQSYKHPFDDPKHGVANERLVVEIVSRYGKECIQRTTPADDRMGKISIFKILCAQLSRYGVELGNIRHDNRDTFGGGFFWSHRAWSRYGGVPGRNFVFCWK